ncbi:MAG TPA: hypothetical protein VMZ73_05920, partial [Acidimicrobiales bacterium]|nr:hypothetical protein [Acidimicrobiales bacterium]
AFDNPPYVHTMSGSDEYASIKINFSVAQAGKVQLLFGGHIAAPTGLRGWGTGFGASSINGGPYHIKWDKFDSESIGRRDNQIMGSSILPLESVVNTTASAGGTIGTSVTDSATIVGASNPTGNITFKLYGPVTGANPTATCIDPAPNANPPVAGNLVFTDVQPVASSGATSASYTPTAVGTYYWVASYSGDGANAPSTGACGDSNESVTITKASPSIATTAVTPVTIGTAVSDRATLTGGTSDISGNITFSLYGPSASASCTNPDPNATPPVVGNRVFTETVAVGPLTNPTAVGAVSSTYTPTTAGSYYWVASYGGDAKNNTATGTCGDTGETSVVNPGTSAISTAQTLLPNDSATLTGLTATAGGTVTFKLFAPGNATCSEVSPAAASYTQAVNVSGPNTYSTTNTTVNATTVGTWRWLVVYSGDTNNTSSTSACGVENFTITNG